jgi:hypothetical protein
VTGKLFTALALVVAIVPNCLVAQSAAPCQTRHVSCRYRGPDHRSAD